MRIYNIEDPNNLAELGSLDTPGRAKDVVVVGEFAYLADGAEGFRVIDISDPANPAETGSLRMQADAWCVTVDDNIAYVGGYHQNLYLIDVSDPENPREISSVWGAGHPLGIAIQDGFAYTSNWCNENGGNISGLSIINVQDPENPEYIGITHTEGQSHDIVVSGEFAYITDGERGLKVFDISDHENIEQIAFYNTPGMACRMAMNGGLIYLADQTNLGIYIPLFDNQAPEVIAEIVDLVIDEDPEPRHVVIADLDDIINDPDGNAGLVFSVQDAPDEVNMEIENDHILSVSPEDNFNLTDGYRVIITAEDIGGLTVETDFMLTINPVNDVPENFQLLEPADESERSYDYPVCFRWSESFDPDEGEDVSYLLSLDCEYLDISLSYQIPEDSTSMTISLDTLNGGCVTVRTLWWVTGISGDDSTECDERYTLLVAGPGNVEQNSQTVFDFGLTTAFPNPFNSTTTIVYSLPHLSDVTLQVYNLAGQKVTTLFEGKRQTGVYNTNMTAYNLPTGIYILKMEASGQVFTQKVMLIK
ncbi:MAG: T9SS type A sorting domain-containing protein [Calditrichaeota bacterium]|nr:T9SS type A sorting domain-containing protein [Calditrichota bacterium]